MFKKKFWNCFTKFMIWKTIKYNQYTEVQSNVWNEADIIDQCSPSLGVFLIVLTHPPAQNSDF